MSITGIPKEGASFGFLVPWFNTAQLIPAAPTGIPLQQPTAIELLLNSVSICFSFLAWEWGTWEVTPSGIVHIVLPVAQLLEVPAELIPKAPLPPKS